MNPPIISINSSLEKGFAMKSLQPASNAFCLSFSKACAVTAITGIWENSFEAFNSACFNYA
jgi:hypothetical protein